MQRVNSWLNGRGRHADEALVWHRKNKVAVVKTCKGSNQEPQLARQSNVSFLVTPDRPRSVPAQEQLSEQFTGSKERYSQSRYK
jgi:hypothetical protein